MMCILWYMPPGNAQSPCTQRSRNTSTRWNASEWSPMLMSQQTGCPPLPTFLRQMVSYACAWIPMTSMRPSATDHHKMPTVEEVTHEFAHSCFFTKLEACHGYWSIILNQDSSLLTTFNSPIWKILFPATSLWPHLLSRHLPEEDGPDTQRVPRMCQNCRWYHCPQADTEAEQDACTYETSCRLPTNMIWCLIHKKHTWRLKPSISLAASMMPMVSNWDLGKVDMLYTPYWCTNKCHWAPRVLRPSHIPQSLHPWVVHLDCPPCTSYSRRTQTSCGSTPTMLLFSGSKKLLLVTPPSGILTPHFPWQYKLMPHR